ncbi:sarcoplasmic calcium-binding s and IV-like [Brachionus plicatilis]|uniref:Sarcoplasmic calcium-binding s and IV-like n=1 Tax=Brachionus plicatilis TaxID=10195 RepID=A0A3M7TAF7_BRAPC|nr:sarcoplasmic calcium-binding s and IV-like [Brachionus plicatilis]
MPRDHIKSETLNKKLRKWYSLTLDNNNDGIISWDDFLAAAEVILPREEAEKNGRLKIVRRRIEQDFQKYFWDLCEVGDANQDGVIDLDEWLDVMNDIVLHLKEIGTLPTWFESLYKYMFRANEFLDDKNVSKEEFKAMLSIWDINAEAVGKAFDFITENGAKKMDYSLFIEFIKKFLASEEPGHVLNLGLDA